MPAAAVLVVATLFLCGCGVGFGAGTGEGDARLTVTRDYGDQILVEESVGPLTQSSTAMRLLDGAAQVETSYGGGFVDSIDSVASASGSRSSDWFFFVNGVAAERGAAEFLVRTGDRMWWDYRDWTDAMEVNAVVGSFPAPLTGGYDDQAWPVSLVCLDAAAACRVTRSRLEEAGVEIAAGDPDEDSLRILVGTWQAVAQVPDAARLDSGPATSGVFADFARQDGDERLIGLDESSRAVADFGIHSGLIAALRRDGDPPVWLVTGTDRPGVEAAAGALTPDDLRNRYAAAVAPEGVFSLPVDAAPPTAALPGGGRG